MAPSPSLAARDRPRRRVPAASRERRCWRALSVSGVFLLAAASTTLASTTLASAAAPTRIAVVPLLGTDKGTTKTARSLTRVLIRALGSTRAGRGARLLPRGRAARFLRCVQQTACLRGLGATKGASHFIAGQVARLGSRLHLDLWLISVESGGIARSGSVRARDGGTLGRRLRILTRRLVSGLPVAEPAVASRPPRRAPSQKTSGASGGIRAPNWAAAGEDEGSGGDADGGVIGDEQESDEGDEPSLWADLRLWTWVCAGAAVVSLGTAAGFGVAALAAKANAEDARYQGEAALEHDAAKKNALAANVLFGVGGVLAAATGALFYFAYFAGKEDREPPKAAAQALLLSFSPLTSEGPGLSLFVGGGF